VTRARVGGGVKAFVIAKRRPKRLPEKVAGHLDDLCRANMNAPVLKQLSVGFELDAPGRHWACVVVEGLLRLDRCEKVPRDSQGVFGDIPLTPMSGLLLAPSTWLFAGIQGGPSRKGRVVAETAGEGRIVTTYRAAKRPLHSGV